MTNSGDGGQQLSQHGRQLQFFRTVVLALFIFVLVRTAWLSDDGFITFRSIDNFLHGYGLRWNVGERVQTYTHPLWMLLLIVPHALTGEAFWSTHLFTIALSTATMGLLLWKVAKTPAQVTALALAVLCCKSFIDFSTSGLENPLTHLLVVLFYLYVCKRGRKANLGVLALFLSFFILTRHDLLLIVAPPMLWCVDWKQIDRRALLQVAAGLAPLVIWEVFSVVYYGFPVPNTAYAKLGGGISKPTVLTMGFNYVAASFIYDPLCLLTIGTGVAVALFGGSLRMKAMAVSAVLYTVYIVWAGGDFMAGRFLTAPFLLSLLLIMERIAQVRSAYGAVPWAAACIVVGLICTPTPVVATGTSYSQRVESFPWTNGVCSERAYYYPYTSLLRNVFQDELGRQPWVRYGKDVRARGKRAVHVYGAIGFRGYFGGPDLHIIDYNALCDPLLARVPTIYPAERPGHLKRKIPAGYTETHRTGINQIQDPDLARYYNTVRQVVTGPLFSLERFKAILAMNLGTQDELVDRRYFTYPEAKKTTLDQLSNEVRRGSIWDAPTNTVMEHSGVFVDLGAVRHDAVVEVSLDLNDRYQLRFLKDGAEVGLVPVGPSHAIRRGMEVYTETVPGDIAKSGYDEIHVLPVDGDKKFSLGHLHLSNAAP